MKSSIFQKLLLYKNSQGRNPSNFSGQFLEIDDFINSFWFNLTFMKYRFIILIVLIKVIRYLSTKKIRLHISCVEFSEKQEPELWVLFFLFIKCTYSLQKIIKDIYLLLTIRAHHMFSRIFCNCEFFTKLSWLFILMCC